MIELSNTVPQTLAVGEAVTFDTVVRHTGCAECHRPNTSSVKLRAKNADYVVAFHANVSGAAADTTVELTIEIGGDPILQSVMQATPSVANAPNNVSVVIPVRNCCDDYNRITIVNTGVVPITVVNPDLFIRRVS